MADPAPESRQVTSGSYTSGPRPPLPGYQPAEDEVPLIARIRDRLDVSQRDGARWALERQMFESIAFYHGIQWLEYSDSSRRLTRYQGPTWLPTPVTNRIAPAVAQMIAPMARMKPQGRVRPNSNETGDVEASRIAEQFVSHSYVITQEEVQRHRAILLSAVTGTVIAEDHWNPRRGKWTAVPRLQISEKPMMEPAAQCLGCGYMGQAGEVGLACPTCGEMLGVGERPIMGTDGNPAIDRFLDHEMDANGQPVVDMFQEGDLETRIRPLFNFYWDPKATTLDEARWCGEVAYVDLDWIDQNYPDKGKHVAAEEGIDSLSFYEASLLSLVGPSVQGAAHYGGSGQAMQNGTVLRKYQERPSQAHPEGLLLVEANGVLLYKGSLPIKDEQGRVTGDFTYTEFRYDEVPGRFPGRTPVDDMIPQQKRVNGIDAQLILNRKTMAQPWILAPKGSGINPAGALMQPGTVLTYNHVGLGVAPQVVQPTPMPEQVLTERAHALEAIEHAARDGAVGPNQVPANVRSGIALNVTREYLQEMAAPRLHRYALWIAQRDRKRLLLMQQFYREERAVKIAGSGNEWQVRRWRGADIMGNTDIVVDPGSLVPKSASTQAQLVLDAIEAGLLNAQNPIERQSAIETLGLGIAFDTDIGPDQRRAKKENARMDEGEMLPTTPVDNHEIHLFFHTAREKDPSFDSLSPAAQQAHQAHRMEHETLLQEAQVKATQQQELEVARQISIAERLRAAGHGGLENLSLPMEKTGQGAERQAA